MHGSSRHQSHFSFRVFIDGEQLHESEALAFDDLEEVWQEGAMTSAELIRSMYGKIESDLDWRLDVSDASGAVIYQFTFLAKRL